MLSVKTINNQNAITNAVLGLDGNSSTIVNGNLIVQDANNSFTITPTGALPATNTTFNNITVNGTSNFNQLALMNLGGRVYSNSFILFNTDFRVMDAIGNLGVQMFNSNDGNNYTTLQAIGANSKFQIRTSNATTQQTNLLIANSNQVTIQGTDGQGITIFNDQTTLNGLTPLITNGPILGDNSNIIATTSFVQSTTTPFLKGYKFLTNPALPFTTN